MTDRKAYSPGPASGAQVRKQEGDSWTLVIVRALRHSPEGDSLHCPETRTS